ncbi:MAG: cytochrome c, partial [Ideonella sp.]
AADQAGVGDWSVPQIVELLVSGVSQRGSVQGPMAEVVFGSTRHLTAEDAAAMAVYLKSLGSDHRATTETSAASAPSETPDAQTIGSRKRGATLYADHCANCHGTQGEGRAGAYPALAGNRGVLLDPPVNLLQTIIHGGFAPTTAGNPTPFGMPPFGLQLSQSEIADLMTYLRSAWGHSASAVGQRDVQRWMERP